MFLKYLYGMTPLARKLKQLREDRRLTQEELAAKLDITRRQYIKYEQGNLLPPHAQVFKLNKIFKCDLSEIIYKRYRD